MSLLSTNLLRCACKNVRRSSSIKYATSKLVRISSRSFASDADLPPKQTFPSFSTKSEGKPGTNFDGFQPNPHPSVFLNTIIKGEPNGNNFSPKVLDKLGQTQNELLKGASYAIEAVTAEISSQRLDNPGKNDSEDMDILRECLTPDCLYRLRNCYLLMEDLREKHYLVRTAKDDIFFSWINNLSIDEYDSTLMQVCTMSMPGHGYIVQKRDQHQEKQQEAIKKIKSTKDKDEKNELYNRLKKDLKEIEFNLNGFGRPRAYIRQHDVIASNFFFKKGPNPDDPWLIDEIMMKNTTEIFSTLKCKRWKGRMVFSLMGMTWRGIFIIDAVYAGSMTALLGLMN